MLGFTGSLQGDLLDAGIPITVHALCPDAADTQLLREHDDEPAAAINWSGPRLLTPDEVAEHAVALLDSKTLVRVIPRWRGWGARATAMLGRPGLRSAAAAAQAGCPPPSESDERRNHMTETTTVPSTGSNGAASAGTIEVENPSTGKVIASVPVVPPEQVAELVARARTAQPGWEALGFDGRAAVLKRCQKWVSDNSQRVIDTIVSETGKAYEDALTAEIGYAVRLPSRSGPRTPRATSPRSA